MKDLRIPAIILYMASVSTIFIFLKHPSNGQLISFFQSLIFLGGIYVYHKSEKKIKGKILSNLLFYTGAVVVGGCWILWGMR